MTTRSGPRRPRAARSALFAIIAALALAGCSTAITGSPERGTAGAPTGGSPVATGSEGYAITVPSGGSGADGSTSPDSTSPDSTSPDSSASGSTTRPEMDAPPGLAAFYRQPLTWQECSGYAADTQDKALYSSDSFRCTRLKVPLDYAKPGGPSITLGVLRKPATGPNRIGSLLLNPGGPGGSGMSFAAQLGAAGVADAVNARFDLVGFDPRGVGASQPAVSCSTDAERDAARQVVDRSNTPAQVAAANGRYQARAQECAARTGAAQGIDGKTFLANVGTRDVARDMDVLRAALGDQKLTYVGISYGTRLGYTYAEQFPTKVRAMVLDGVVAPDLDPALDNINQAASFQKAFTTYAAYCASHQPCVLGTDPATATAVFQKLTRPLLDKLLPLPDGRKMSFGDATTGTVLALYSDSLWPQLSAALLNFSKGDGQALMALADQYEERDSTGHYNNILSVLDAVGCVDGPRITDPALSTKFNADYAAAAPFLATGDPAGPILSICAAWPVPPTLTPHELSIPGLPKLLVVSTKGDPATPYASGVSLAEQLKASLLSVEGTRHGAYLTAGISCVDKIGDAYLIAGTAPPAGTDCS